jgi:glycyl-tRNA synthetase beta subunit
MYNLLEKYPYATEKLREWFMQKMIESLEDQAVPEDFKAFMRSQGVPNDKLATIFKENPRALFDVFDANNVIINVLHTNDDDKFTWNVNNVKNIQQYSSRREAEKDAVERAFQLLDEKLNIIVSETKNDEGQDSTTGDQ